ncbi:MAG: GDP-mannose 4,6-dehydratase [Fimbriiglobus sp.]
MSDKNHALIVGIGGQDGSYLADVLLERGWTVSGTVRRSSGDNRGRIKHLIPSLHTLHACELEDQQSIDAAMYADPHTHVFNMADQDHVGTSFGSAAYSADVTYAAPVRMMESLYRRKAEYERAGLAGEVPRFFQPASVTMYGNNPYPSIKVEPDNPYAVSKAAAYYAAGYYRRRGLHVSTAVFGNHDSPRRGSDYFLQRMCKAAVLIAAGKLTEFVLEDPWAIVDIGYARDYMEAVADIAVLDVPADHYVTSGRPVHVHDLWDMAISEAGIPVDQAYKYTKTDKSGKKHPGYVGPRHDRMKTKIGELVAMIVAKYKTQFARGELA